MKCEACERPMCSFRDPRVPADHLSLLEDIVKALRRARSPTRLVGIMEPVTLDLGFGHFAIIEHCDLRPGPPEIICFQNYPAIWADKFIAERLYLHDPILRACLTIGIGFEWSDVADMIRLTAFQRKMLSCARREGLGAGYSIPYNVPGQRRGSCNFAVRRGRDMPHKNLLAADMIGGLAFHAARRILHPRPFREPIDLTPRQLECVVLAGQGKSDSVIGQLLGLSKNSITNYMTAARQRFDVATREQLVVAALFEGVIGFPDLIVRQ